MYKKLLIIILSICILSACQKSSEKGEIADFVYINGKIYTVNEAQPWAEAVGVKGNKIVFVGSEADAETFKGDETEVFDQNLFEIDPHDIYKVKILMTMMDGVVRYQEGM